MCFFITMAVPADAADEVARRHAEPGLRIDRTGNPSAVEAAGPARTPLLVTGGGCSCAWYRRPGTDPLHDRARAEAKYRRLGWSETKIERAIASMRKAPRPGDGVHAVVMDLLTAVAHDCGEVCVWVHDFTGRVEREPYAITRRIRCACADLPAYARVLDTDVALTVAREP